MSQKIYWLVAMLAVLNAGSALHPMQQAPLSPPETLSSSHEAIVLCIPLITHTGKGQAFFKKLRDSNQPGKTLGSSQDLPKQMHAFVWGPEGYAQRFGERTCQNLSLLLSGPKIHPTVTHAVLGGHVSYKQLMAVIALAADLQAPDSIIQLLGRAMAWRLVRGDEGLGDLELREMLARPTTQQVIKQLFTKKVCWQKNWATLKKNITPPPDPIDTIACSAGMQYFATAREKAVTIFDFATNNKLFSLSQTSPIKRINWSPTGSLLAIATKTTVTIYDCATRKEIYTQKHKGPIGTIAWSLDGHNLATLVDNTTVHVFTSGMTGTTETRTLEPGYAISALALNEDGTQLALGTLTGKVFLYTIATGTQIFSSEQQGAIVALSLSKSTMWCAVTSRYGTITLVNVGSQERVKPFLLPHSVKAILFSPDHSILVILSNTRAQIVDLTTREPIANIQHPAPIQTAAISADGQYLITGSCTSIKITKLARTCTSFKEYFEACLQQEHAGYAPDETEDEDLNAPVFYELPDGSNELPKSFVKEFGTSANVLLEKYKNRQEAPAQEQPTHN